MNRKILYGYQIQNGELTIHPQEAEGVTQIFSMYLTGISQQQVADALNRNGICYSQDSPVWSRQRITQALRNPHYAGKDGYPVIIDNNTFRLAQEMIQKRTRRRGNHPALCLVKKLRCNACGNSLRRISERQWRETLRFHCDECGAKITIPDAALLAEVERQAAEYEPSSTDSTPYTPSEDTIRLTNAINRGLEHPDYPEEVTALIMQGISARYACFPMQMTSMDILRLIKEKAYDQAIQYITISADNAVTVTFK